MHIRGDHAELVVGGRLDVRSAADARTALHDAVDAGRGDLVLDLTELDSWDATGLGVIMGAHRRAGRANRRLVLRGACWWPPGCTGSWRSRPKGDARAPLPPCPSWILCEPLEFGLRWP
jgi:anti-anti-sigma factor